MFINLSNHPSSKWNDSQKNAAIALGGEISDYPFPGISPDWSTEQVAAVAQSVFDDIMQHYGNANPVMHIVGEYTFTHVIVNLFQAAGIRCYSSCTERISEDNPDGTKTSRFVFVQFRMY